MTSWRWEAMKRKERREKALGGGEWELWPAVWHSAHALSACGHWDVKLLQRLFLILVLRSWLFALTPAHSPSAEWCLVEIMLSICVQGALQVFNITPFLTERWGNAEQWCWGEINNSVVHFAQKYLLICSSVRNNKWECEKFLVHCMHIRTSQRSGLKQLA